MTTPALSTSPYPTRLLAGISIPDTPTITKSIAYAHENLDTQTYNHVMRSWLMGSASLSHLPENSTSTMDLEAFAVANILHDMGWANNSAIVSEDKRFEVDGANAAAEFLRKEGWSEDRIRSVWYAIALHTETGIAAWAEPLVVSMCVGVGIELFGLEIAAGLFGDKVAATKEERDQINAEFPRDGLKDHVIRVHVDLCRRKPRSTIGTYQADFGEKYLKEEGFTEVGFRNIDLIEKFLE